MNALDKLDQAIRERLGEAERKRKSYIAAIEQEMNLRQEREKRFEEIAVRLKNEVIGPRAAKVMGYFPNAKSLSASDEQSVHCRYLLDHSDLFPATTKLDISIDADRAVENIIIGYDLQILPQFIQFRGHDQLVVPLNAVSDETISSWVEGRLVDFVDTYLRVADADEYADTSLIDPVCGMTVRKSIAMEAIVAGHSYWFCSESCKERFLKHPSAFARPRKQGT